jgi:hypothetical protein
MEDYDIQANWTRPAEHLPSSGTRCIVTDGDVIVIATFVADPDGHTIWIFSGIAENDSKSFTVQGWMPLPRQIKKVVVYETTVAENKGNS